MQIALLRFFSYSSQVMTFAEKITFLNQVLLECLNETDEKSIVKACAEAGLKVLSANFGFVWLSSSAASNFELVYRSADLPFTPQMPREGGRNQKVMNSARGDFVTDVAKAPDAEYLKDFLKSFAIIPICYKNEIYGNIVFCFTEIEPFPKEKRILCEFIGNAAAQAITIHRLVLAEQESRAVKEKFEQEKIRTEFIADATHEIRTPLAIIQGNVDLALRKGKGLRKPKSASAAFKAIRYEIEHLSALISDLALLTTKGKEVQRKVVSHDVHIAELLERVVARSKAIAYQKNISIRMKKIPDMLIKGDAAYLEKLFLNLIKNAIIYGKEKGFISIAVLKNTKTATVEVSDNGIGISVEDLPRIFDRFYRVDKTSLGDGRRSGLGLAISKWIVETHGGKIEVESTLGKGSTFRVILPLVS